MYLNKMKKNFYSQLEIKAYQDLQKNNLLMKLKLKIIRDKCLLGKMISAVLIKKGNKMNK